MENYKITGIGYSLYEHDIDEKTFNILNQAKYLYIDTETMGLNLHRDRLCLVQILGDNNDRVSLIRIAKVVQPHSFLQRLLNNENIIKVFHYAVFDMSVIQKYLHDIKWTNVACTKILSKVTRTFTDRHGLVTLCKDLLNINLVKDSQASDWGADTLSPQQQAYGANDVIYLRPIFAILYERAVRENRIDIVKNAFITLPHAINIMMGGFELQNLLNHA